MDQTIAQSADEQLAEIQASELVRAAILLDQAKMNRAEARALVAALDNNLELWVLIRTLVQRPDCFLPQDAKDNLTRLSHYVGDVTLGKGAEIADQAIDTLTNVNVRIAEGFLQGIGKLKLP
ncbi:MAG: hypothetical protein HY985_09710 [Magnetospirillum sp.]|nr:hypothetical protein [Magnetospirillum sp.]